MDSEYDSSQQFSLIIENAQECRVRISPASTEVLDRPCCMFFSIFKGFYYSICSLRSEVP